MPESKSKNGVHSDLQELYERYKIFGVGLVICSTLPCITLFIMYGTKSGLLHLGSHMLIVVVSFVLGVPLMLTLAYYVSLKRMRYLERASDLVRAGKTQGIVLLGKYKLKAQSGNMVLILDLASDENSDSERYSIIPNPALQEIISACPDLSDSEPGDEEKTSAVEKSKLIAYMDPETKRPVAVEMDGKILWISPPEKLAG